MSLRQSRWKNRSSPCCHKGSLRYGDARGPAPMPGMRAPNLQCVWRPDENDRPPPSVPGPPQCPECSNLQNSQQSGHSQVRKCKGQPLPYHQADRKSSNLPSCSIFQKTNKYTNKQKTPKYTHKKRHFLTL